MEKRCGCMKKGVCTYSHGMPRCLFTQALSVSSVSLW